VKEDVAMTGYPTAGTPHEGTTKTEGAIKAGQGQYTFDLAGLRTIDAGPGYSTAPLAE
jgi:hypothetical protein